MSTVIGEMDEVPQADCAPGAPHPRHTPQLFGHSEAEAEFLDAYNSGRMHHAWLITGPRGVGKATLAWRLARFLLTQPLPQTGGMFEEAAPIAASLDVDTETPAVRRAASLSEPRLKLVRRAWDKKAKRLKTQLTVEEVRELNGFFHFSATEGGYRVVIVDASDEMNTNAANALLKTLEEPPAHAVLLLIAHQPSRLLPTIRSRCRTLRLGPLEASDLAHALDATGVDVAERTDALAELSAGSVGDAIRLTNLDGMDTYRDLVALFETMPRLDRPSALKLAESCVGAANAERFDLVIGLMDRFLTRLARTGAGRPPIVEAAKGEAALMARLAPDGTAARDWAALQASLSARARHARGVNLDPAALILDMVFKINDTAARVTA
ncbi:DNA polymerase III subunit delta' [Celeribacter arenosi]|uniref:DNA polymerase III subunit delta n=1 Tax=Celeribacter arenosi TaxID=792649 RepID=A0ABP7JV57_9RHOB